MSKLLIPNEYQLINEVFPEMGFPTREGEMFGIRTDEFNAIILKCIVPEEVAMNFDDSQSIIDDFHNDIPKNAGLIESGHGKTENMNKYVYFIMKHGLKGEDNAHLGNEYTMNMNVKIDEDVYFIQSSFAEEGITGVREAFILDALAKEYGSLQDAWNQISSDPYDASYSNGFLMNLSEDEIYDDLFPNHPLSKAREFVEFILDNN